MIVKTKVLFILLSALICDVSFASKVYFFDFDNTIVENREEFKGSFQGTVELYRVVRRSSLFQEKLAIPDKVQVSWADYDERLKPYLAKNYDEQGIVGKKITLQDGRVIEPAHYYVRTEDSFKFYFPGEKGENYLLEEYAKARKTRGGNWKGKAWGLFEHVLSDAENAKNVGFITMRGQTKNEWRNFFKQLINDGHIKNMPNLDWIMGLPKPEFDRFTLHYSVEQRHLAKSAVLEEFIDRLGRVALTEKDVVLNPDGTKQEPYHFLVFAEDNQETLDRVAKVFQKYAQGKQYRIKFALINTGYQKDVDASGRPRFAVVTSNGTFRRATQAEVLGHSKKAKTKAEKCALALLKATGGGN
ncbi:MAG: hypothetical protein IPM57_11960 [Oligoflexia bacterium]|nr:hypothetical protein [Oligoflexia bacterium]